MQLSELVEKLLKPVPLSLEMGYERLAGGVLHVAARTDMHGCSGAMLEWWFGSRPGTREYGWWHPLDHQESTWDEGSPGACVGTIHKVIERFTGGAPEALSIQFIDPGELFAAHALQGACQAGHVSGVVCARGGAGHAPARTADGAVIGSRLIHLCRDTPWGMVLRTHFYLGHDLPGLGVPFAQLERLFPDELGPRLLQHCYDEFTFLSRLLPALYEAEREGGKHALRPW